MGHRFSYHDLQFAKMPVQCTGSQGSPYTRWIDFGMPIIPRALLNCVVYLYRSKEDADAGENAGGTGFIAAMPTPDELGHHYIISNWHVAVQGGYSCFRINTAGGFETFEYGPEDWIFEPGGDDVAVLPVDLRSNLHMRMFLSTGIFVKAHEVEAEQIGPGDDFMIGRFVDIEQKTTNIPAVRFGNISTPPVAIKQETGYKDGACYCIDMHSRGGYSGSPVFFYRTPGNTLEWMLTGQPLTLTNARCAFLGIHIGQFPEEMAIKRKEKKKPKREESLSEKSYEEYIEGMSGMTCVVPAWRVQRLLETHPELLFKRDMVENMRLKKRKPASPAPESASDRGNSKPSGKSEPENPNHLRDFESLLDKASQPVKPKKGAG